MHASTPPGTTPLIHLEGITFGYSGRRPILDDLDFQLLPGERAGLLGPNGSGKTTLFHIIMGLMRPQSGTIELFGKQVVKEKEFREFYSRIGLLFQDADDQLFSPTVLEDVAFGPLNMGKSKQEAVDIARKTLADLGLDGFEDRITHKLSGGEKRLVSLATVLAMKPEVLLLDEPSTGLDTRTKQTLVEVLGRLNLSYIIISHEGDFMEEVADIIYTMEDGQLRRAEYIHSHVHAHPHAGHDH